MTACISDGHQPAPRLRPPRIDGASMGLPQPIEDATREAILHPRLLRFRVRIISRLRGKRSVIRKWVAEVGLLLERDVQAQASVSIWLTTSPQPARAAYLWRSFTRSCMLSQQERYQVCPLGLRLGTLALVPIL